MERQGRREEEETGSTLSTRREEEEEEEEEEVMKEGAKDKVICGHTPISASSSFPSFPFLSSSLCRGGGGGGEEDEVRVSIVTIEDESCPSEPFGIDSHRETTNRIERSYGEGDEKEEGEREGDEEEKEDEEEEANSDEREEEEEENAEVTSPSLHLLSQTGGELSRLEAASRRRRCTISSL